VVGDLLTFGFFSVTKCNRQGVKMTDFKSFFESINTQSNTLDGVVRGGSGQPGSSASSYDVYRVYSRENTTGSVGLKAYNTGKVLIGAAYQPRPRYELSTDSERLQRALLDSKHARDARTEALFMRFLYGIAAIGVIVIIATR
jgi:hypothetical protein